MAKYLVVPDIHGREFWKIAEQYVDKVEKIIFLGDYLDPYPFENIKVSDAIHNFVEILNFKKANADKVILLLGNHDMYYFERVIGNARYSYENALTIENIFDENRELFQIAYETEITLFTHAGYIKWWESDVTKLAEYNKLNIEPIVPTAERLNKFLTIPLQKNKFGEYMISDEIYPLFFISRERGGRNGHGSPIWADLIEHTWTTPIDKYQVFGHTLQVYYDYDQNKIIYGKALIEENYAMLDNCKAYLYDEENKTFEIV